MRVSRAAALYDIHGNLPALEAVLEQVHAADIDAVVIGGDVIPGPMPRECLAALRELDLPTFFIHGNGEIAVAAARAGEDPGVGPMWGGVIDWVARQVSSGDEQWFSGWPLSFRLDVEGIGEVLFCHATPRSDTEIFTKVTPEQRILPAFAGVYAPLVVCGHTHMQFDRRIASTRVVNAGSVGMPFGEPGAYWLLLGPDVRLQRTEYDVQAAADRLRRTKYPQADAFAADYVLHPPSEQQMLEKFNVSL